MSALSTSTQLPSETLFPSSECIIVNSPSLVYIVIGIYCFVCLINTATGFYAMIMHYCSSKTRILLQLRIFSLLGTIFFTLYDYDATVDVYFALKCDLSLNSLSVNISDVFGTLGYFCLYFLFVLKLKHGFKDSLFEVSKKYIRVLTILGIIGITFSVFGVITFTISHELQIFAVMLNGVAYLCYIIGNILLGKKLFTNLFAYFQFVNDNYKNQINVESKIFQAFVRLTIGYTVAILSTGFVIGILAICGFTMSSNATLFNYLVTWFRLLVILDHLVNIICLLFQHQTANQFYNKCCYLCHSRAIQCAKKRINKDVANIANQIQDFTIESSQK